MILGWALRWFRSVAGVRSVGSVSACCPFGLAGFRAACRPVSLPRCGSKEARAHQPESGVPTAVHTIELKAPFEHHDRHRPHKATHTAVAIDSSERCSPSSRFERPRPRRNGPGRGRSGSRRGPGRSSPPEGSATSSPSSWWLRARRCWMCPRCWRPGCGCWVRAVPKRTTRTMPALLPSPRCGLTACVSWSPMTMPES